MKRVYLIGLLLLLNACSQPQPNVRIVFAEKDDSSEPYMSRAIVTPQYMRIDYNKDDDDYILFDRKTAIIYSVIHGEKNIVVVKPREFNTESAMKLDVEVIKGKLDTAAPSIDGKQPQYFQYKVNGQLCYETISVAGFLPSVSEAHRQYLKTLAGEHDRVLTQIPADQQDACDLASNIYHYKLKFEHGFPINEWHGAYNQGYKRQMVDYEIGYQVAPGLLTLPDDYKRYEPKEMSSQ